MAKRLSGGRRRTLRKQGKAPGKPGFPKGTTSKKVMALLLRPHGDLTHELFLDPEWQSQWLTSKRVSAHRLAEFLQKKLPERYGHLPLRTFRRHVAAVKSTVHDPRAKGANTLAKIVRARPSNKR